MKTSHPRGARAAVAIASVAPAIQASAERAAIERNLGDTVDPAIVAGAAAPIVPSADLPAADATVLPEPTLVAEPGSPQPIVTASPPLAAEPSAMDVVKAEAADERAAAGLEPGDLDAAHPAAAGQTMLAIDGAGNRFTSSAIHEDRTFAHVLSPGLGDGLDLDAPPTIDVIIAGLEHLSRTDSVGMDIIRTSFFADEPRDAPEQRMDPFAKPRTVTVYEVVGPAGSRRRAGRSFGPQPQRFLANELTKEDIAALRSDPLLAVGTSEVEADAFGYPIHDV